MHSGHTWDSIQIVNAQCHKDLRRLIPGNQSARTASNNGCEEPIDFGDSEMQIIVVSGKAFSGGSSFAEALAYRLGYRWIDADVVIERAAAYGPSQEELNEALRRPPRAWDRFLCKRRRNLLILLSALAEELGCHGAVCHGNLGDLLLGLDGCLRIRIDAPPDFRIQTVCDRLRLSHDEAVDYIRREDRNRERWVRDVCGRDAVGTADVVLSLERLTVEEASEFTARLVQSRSQPRLIRSGSATLGNFALACRVRAALATTAETANLELDAAVDAGVVTLSGMIRSPEQLREVQRVAWSVPAIAGVVLNGEAVQRPPAVPDSRVRAYQGNGGWAAPWRHLLRPAWAQMGLALGLTIAGSWSLSRLGSRMTANLPPHDDGRAFVGIITDTICGPKPMDAQCVRTCVRSGAGAKYALYDGEKLYRLADDSVADRYAAQKVRIRGTLNGTAGTLKVDSIQPIS